MAGLWHIGASTHPGPGLGAGSGYLVAKELTKPPIPHRLLANLRGAREPLPLRDLDRRRVVRGGRRAYAAAGFDAIGIWEFKLPADDEANLALLASTASASRSACPRSRRCCRSRSPAWKARPRRRAHRRARRDRRRFAAYEPECVAASPGRRSTRLAGRICRRRTARLASVVAREAGTSGSSRCTRPSGRPWRLRQLPRRRGRAARRCRPADRDPSTPTTSGARLPGASPPSASASPAPLADWPTRSTAPTASFRRGHLAHEELVAALVAQAGTGPRRRDLLDARALLGPPGRRGRPPRYAAAAPLAEPG